MGKEHNADLLRFLEPFEKDSIDLVLWLRDFVWDMYPQANELIYDNYNAVAFGWSPTDRLGHTFCTIAVYRSGKRMHFGFYWGNELSDPEKLLLGEGNQYRYIHVTDKKSFPRKYIRQLIREAWANSMAKVKEEKQLKQGLTIVKSISSVKRESRPAAKSKR